MKLKLLFLPRYHCDPNDYRPINPPHFPPLGISTLTAYMKQHHYHVEQDDLDIKVAHKNKNVRECEKIDLKQFVELERYNRFLKTKNDPGYEDAAEKILKLTKTDGFDVFGFSLMPTDNPSSASVALALAKVLKKKHGSTIIIGGSIHGEVDRQLIETGFVDYRILGHPGTSVGEPNLLKFCQQFEKGLSNDVVGAAYIKNRKYVRNGREYDLKDEITITTPCFEGLPMDLYKRELTIEKNRKKVTDKILIIPYFFIRGCPHKCAFCSHSLQNYWQGKNPEIVAEDLKFFSKKYKTKFFYFHNCSINPTYSHAEAFANAMIKNDVDILWSDCANFEPLDKNLLVKLKKSGALRMVFGFESASPTVLSLIHKNFTVGKAVEVLKLCKKLKIWPELDMISGFPYESQNDTQASLKFLRKHKEFIGACSLNKFWLEGTFMNNPEKYGIEVFEDRKNTHNNWSNRGFNEIYGMKWDNKIKEIIKNYDVLYEEITNNFITAPDAHRLFFLYKHNILFNNMKK